MRSTFAGLALVAVAAAKPVPQSSSSCSPDYSGSFEIQVLKMAGKVKRQDSALTLTLSGGVLMDSEGRTGYIASNYQFQFDAPPQANAIEVDGFSVCGDMLAHQGDTTWQQCLSGNFYNLYSDNKLAAGNAGQCEDVNIQVIGGSAAPSGGATQIPDGQVTASGVTSVPVTQISDGQPQASTAVAPVTQISDGQIQATTAAAAPVTQITDGQPQAPTAVVTQITDGQPQAPTAVVTQITDGQPQAPTAVVTQITDGQPQAPVATCTQIVDGQPQCPVASGTGMMPYPGANTTVAGSQPSAPVPATGAASSMSIGSSVVGLVAAVAALAMF